ncbi:sortase-dependent protein [Kitasatospora purpeofusca]|uniref:sortase-dependent protein n=1 Tax=Kitasatospora purpeofusca TaxID=67352 RepID=UPI0036480BA7
MALRTTTNRARRSAAVSRLTAVCALTGAALLATVTGGQAWADGGAPAAPSAAAAPATPTATPAAPSAGAGSGPAVKAPQQPSRPATAQPPTVEQGKEQAKTATPTALPEGVQPKPQAPADAKPQVREVPKGAAQAGDGSGAGDSSGLKLVGGGAVAAVGAGALGFALLRRRSGARG